MPKDFVSFGDIVKDEPGLGGLRNLLKNSDVVAEFSVLFPTLNKIAEAIKADKKTLFLKVENPTWRNELKIKEKVIIERINKFFKEERIKWIKFIS